MTEQELAPLEQVRRSRETTEATIRHGGYIYRGSATHHIVLCRTVEALAEALRPITDTAVYEDDNQDWHCAFCDNESDEQDGFRHEAGCPVPAALALLDQLDRKE